MKAALKSFDCVDHDPIYAWHPGEGEDVDYHLCLHIGPAEKEGADLFYVNVLSEGAAGRCSEVELAAKKKIVISEYSWAAVKARVEEIVRASNGDDWNAIAKKLSQSFDWEFDSYEEEKNA
jgi:hypothetical protein